MRRMDTTSTLTKRRLTFVVEFSSGHAIERTVDNNDSREARRQVWESLTDAQRDQVEDIDCIGDEQVPA